MVESRPTTPGSPRPQSFRSSRVSQSRRPSIERIYSAQHFDDHTVYHPEDDESEAEHEAVGDEGFAGDADDRSRDTIATLTNSREGHEKEEYEDPQEVDRGDGAESEEVIEVRGGVLDIRDVEKGHSLGKSRSQRSTKTQDPNLVTWDGPDDPESPKNWPMKRKWAATFVVSSFTFISPVSSSMVAPSLDAISSDLGITTEIEAAMVLSIFVLAYAIGPLFLGPLSEIYGRVIVLQLSNLFYLAWNTGCGFAQTKGQMLAFRFLSGLGGSAPLAIGGGLLSDVWTADQRGKAISIYSLAPLLGPALGPIAGGFITENTTWRWSFWATSLVDAAIQLAGLWFLQETYAPTLLARKSKKLRQETGNEALHTEWETPERTLPRVLKTAMIRPFILLGTQPIIQFISVYMAFLYGLMYLILSTFPDLWTDEYGESIGIGGLNYLSLGLGFFLGTQICAPLNDKLYRRLKKKNNDVGRPEFRVPLIFVGSSLIPIGLFWYGWSAEAKTQWIMPNIGAVIFAAGSIINFQCMQTYIVDSYTRYAASGVAAAVVLRSLAGFGFPLFATYMYDSLGYGWGNSLLGFIAIVLGIPAPFIFWVYGEKLRGMSKFAAG